MRMELKKLHLKMNTTTIYVTHDQIEAMTLADRIVILKDGRIQQVGTPVEVFEQPVNRFVAGFIGNPPINVLPAVITGSGANAILAMGDLRLPIHPPQECRDGQQVLAGIRPDAIETGRRLADLRDDWQVEATVVLAEILGGHSLLEFTAGGNTMIAEVEGRLLARPGEKLMLGFDLERLLLFDPQSGLTLR
jgi:multiple sugar transport system ATP-binding protein